jgi:hypothetical protein
MELTYENMVKHMDNYFADYNRYGGDPKTLPNMLKYYTPDILLYSYAMKAEALPLERILQAMTHVGLHEEFTPNYYVVDEQRKIVVVQMKNQFTEESTHKTFPAKELSVHYHFLQDKKGDIKINKIQFFTEAGNPNEGDSMMKMMRKYYEKTVNAKEKGAK